LHNKNRKLTTKFEKANKKEEKRDALALDRNLLRGKNKKLPETTKQPNAT
jgi:hypothetical protein